MEDEQAERHQLQDKSGPQPEKYTDDRKQSAVCETTDERQPFADSTLEAKQLPKYMIVLLNISFLGLNLMFLVLSVVVVPAQVQTMVGSASKGRVLGAMVGSGAFLTLLSGPLIGMISDRMTSRFGKRRPVMVVATLCLCKKIPLKNNDTSWLDENGMCNTDLVDVRCRPYHHAFNGTYDNPYLKDFHTKKLTFDAKDPNLKVDDNVLSGNLGLFVAFYFLVTVSYVCTTTPYNALIADKAHPTQRGLSSGVMGGMILLGNISGAAVGISLNSLGVLGIYILVICIMGLCITVTVLSIDEPPSKDIHEPIKHDFRWVFITRFLMQQGLSTTVGSICCGVISDRIGRRKPLIIAASILMGICAGLLAGLRGQMAFYIATGIAVVFGISFGSYQAVDFALLMDVLPEAKDKSRDIAVWQQALVLPQALAVPVGGIILDIFERIDCTAGLGYIILFSITATYFILGGVFVTRIRRAK
uniref:MFS domain-containing protein n=1 Tax=Macrostomum lignano TaxID=282301 RepID=A0A1I8ISD5_9PLAT